MISLEMPSIKRIEAIAQGMQDCISLAQGALRIGGVDQHTKEYARQILLSDKADYYQDPAGIVPLRQRLALTLAERHGVKITNTHILVSHGSVGALMAFCLMVLGKDDEVVLPAPTYPTYNHIVQLAKAKPVFTNSYQLKKIRETHKHEWVFDLETIKKALTAKTRMIILSNPSNPTGAMLSSHGLQDLSWLCEKQGIYLVVDEVYDDYVYDGFFSASTPYAVHSQFTIRLGSFSKNFGMSGWRIGYLVGQPDLIQKLGPIQSATLSCPTVISQYAALYALEHREYTDHYAAILKKNRDVLCDFFDGLETSELVEYGRPAGSFYLFFKIKKGLGSDIALDILNRAKVALTPGDDFGPSYSEYIRLCFARDPEVIAQAIMRLKNYFSAKHVNLHKEPVHSTNAS